VTFFTLIDAANRAGIRQMVFLSLPGVQGDRRTTHYAVEPYLRQHDAPYTFLRPTCFMQNLSTTYAERIRQQNEIYVPAGRSRTVFIDARDIGRVAARVLCQPGHLRHAYTLSGEQSLSCRNIADILTSEPNRPIRYPRPSETRSRWCAFLGSAAEYSNPPEESGRSMARNAETHRARLFQPSAALGSP
jgi:uncharacterized protein YbjT (DUF2867 family)